MAHVNEIIRRLINADQAPFLSRVQLTKQAQVSEGGKVARSRISRIGSSVTAHIAT